MDRRIEAIIDAARELADDLPDLDPSEVASLTRSELESRIEQLQDKVREVQNGRVGDIEDGLEELVSELQSLYNDV